MATPQADRSFQVTVRAVAAVALMFAVGAFVRFGRDPGLSTLMGGAVAVMNLVAMRRVLGNIIAGAAEGDLNRGRGWATLAVLKQFILLVGVALLLIRGIADPIPFLVGYLALPVGIVVGALISRESDASQP
jgi:hypothetical protein